MVDFKIDQDAISDFSIVNDYICEFGITSMSDKQKELVKQLAKSLLKQKIAFRKKEEENDI